MSVSSTGVRWRGLALFGWALSVGFGFCLLGAYQGRPGDPGAAAGRWPDGSSIVRSRTKPTLLMFLHPLCPCSGASVAEWQRLTTRQGKRVAPVVVMVAPSGPASGEWDRTELESAASSTPGVEVKRDRGGLEAERFGVATSGHVLLFDTDGTLQFSGGITAARGHEGGNDGLDALTALIEGGRPSRSEWPVFACPLVRPRPPDRPGGTS